MSVVSKLKISQSEFHQVFQVCVEISVCEMERIARNTGLKAMYQRYKDKEEMLEILSKKLADDILRELRKLDTDHETEDE